MGFLPSVWEAVRSYLPTSAVLIVVVIAVIILQKTQETRRRRGREIHFLYQLVLLGVVLLGLLGVVLVLPIQSEPRGQLLGLIGILSSAAIALSSTTFLGNALAGVMLRMIRNFRIGDFLRVGGHFGRVSERGLLHTEIQTEDRDLTTLPNLYLVTHAVTVIRASGTIVSASLSVGYDVSHTRVEELLIEAARGVDLREPFVQILDLGSFAVTYRIAGLLTETKQILSARSLLRGAVLDSLHNGGIEIVSPTYMNTRAIERETRIRPPARTLETHAQTSTSPEAVVFDKAEEAESLEKLRAHLGALEEEIASARAAAKEASQVEKEDAERRISQLDARKERLSELVRRREELAKKKDADNSG